MIDVHGKTLVKSFKQLMLQTYGLRIKVHQGYSMGQFAEDEATVASARSDSARDPSGRFTLWGTMTVQQAEDAVRSAMGFAIQILDSHGGNADNSSTLNDIGFMGLRPTPPSGPRPESRPQPQPNPAPATPAFTAPAFAASTSMPLGTGAATDGSAKSKVAAGVLGILIGAFGVHNFYLGFTGKAVAQLLITLLSCGTLALISSIWGLVEGIFILTGRIDRDARGIPLRD